MIHSTHQTSDLQKPGGNAFALWQVVTAQKKMKSLVQVAGIIWSHHNSVKCLVLSMDQIPSLGGWLGVAGREQRKGEEKTGGIASEFLVTLQ